MHLRLAALCGIGPAEFARRAALVQARVERIRDSVNARRSNVSAGSPEPAAGPWWKLALTAIEEAVFTEHDDVEQPVIIREEFDDHVVFEGLTLAAVAEIEANPRDFPGVRIIERAVRRYPGGSMAAHVVGQLGAESSQDESASQSAARVGISGAERQFEQILRGRAGIAIDQVDRAGNRIASKNETPVFPGRDVILSLDARLQRTAEALLDGAVERTATLDGTATSGGAMVVLDVHSGRVLALASAPRFDPGSLADTAQFRQLADSASKPLFDRALAMALPPGSVFKIVSAAALIECGAIDPSRPFECQGYWTRPDRERCLLFRRQGKGHGPVNLEQALAQSCNVYFFHHATAAGAEPLVEWAGRFGLGERTGIDLPGEARGRIPVFSSQDGKASGQPDWSGADTRALAIGQSTLLVSPLQMACIMAAIADGGELPTPRISRSIGLTETLDQGDESASLPPPAKRKVEGLSRSTLDALRAGLRAVVADEYGTAHAQLFSSEVEVAGKTGTAETGAGQGDHAWFAGYAPPTRPEIAFAIVIEHGGAGSEAASLARRLISKLKLLGYFDSP